MAPSSARPPAAAKAAFKSPPRVQVWFLRRSRDGWKTKYQALKVEAKRLHNRVADVCKSRDLWRVRAEEAERRLRQQPAHPDAGPPPLPPREGKKGAPSPP